MDIPALSIAMHQASLAQNVNIALTKTAMQHAQAAAEETVKMLPSRHPTAGHSIDVKV
ncbi:YjfB family protein [Bacillus amyloliquefaciens]|uniref:YjfB family protein n=1 Tax=Bacillus amyloliquefaciens TaxID=1390 RepID=UPI000D6CACB7|nr:YjfB family protein [Bacillus amyloliquefaciens]AWM43717.1 putative motility protein [Bacillus amyloliquefaciens]